MYHMNEHPLPALFSAVSTVALLCVHLCAVSALHADPLVSSSTSVDQDLMNVTVSGSDLPEFSSITLNCTYDPQRAELMDAIISSPLPSTAFSAFIDTSECSLSVSVCATGTLQITDGSTLVTLRIPLTGSEERETAFALSSAAVTDASGETRAVPVGSTAVATSPLYRTGTTVVQHTGNNISVFYLLNGKRGNRLLPRSAPGCLIRYTPDRATIRGKIIIR